MVPESTMLQQSMIGPLEFHSPCICVLTRVSTALNDTDTSKIKKVTNQLNISKQFTLFNLHLFFPRNKLPQRAVINYILFLFISFKLFSEVRTHFDSIYHLQQRLVSFISFKLVEFNLKPPILLKSSLKNPICKFAHFPFF